MRARVYRSTGSRYTVKNENGETFSTRIKGIFKIDQITSTNPIAVGDIVDIEPEDVAENTAVITGICDRKNYIARSSPHSRKHHHIIASNLDQVLLIATLKEPKTSQGFIDRCFVSAEAYHIPPIVVFNKIDLYKKKEWEAFEKLQNIYQSIGYPVHKLSMKTMEGVDALGQMLENKITLFFGHSGVGKSTVINYIIPDLELSTKEVSGWSGKGMHTTTFAEMFDLPSGSPAKIIDTPGLREFAITDIERPELSHYFPEMRALVPDCKFNNCLHIEEPGCAVKEAVEDGKIYMERYISYYNILQTMPENDY